MRKEFPVNIESEDEWIDLPQGTHIHPKEVEKMFDEGFVGKGGIEYIARFTPRGKIEEEAYGDNDTVSLTPAQTYDDVRDTIISHSHPKAINEGEILSAPALSEQDLHHPHREIRAFSQDKPFSSARIHSFKHIDKGTIDEVDNRLDIGKKYDQTLKKNNEMYDFMRANNMRSGYNQLDKHTASEFDLGRTSTGQTSVIKVRKSEDPKKMYITGIRSTYKDEPQYDLLQTLPRKKKKTQPLVNRININTSINFGKINLNGLNQFLVKPKIANKSVKSKIVHKPAKNASVNKQ